MTRIPTNIRPQESLNMLEATSSLFASAESNIIAQLFLGPEGALELHSQSEQ